MRSTVRGFSLLELMIAVVIVGILAAIALPAYDGYVRRANRTLAKTVLTEITARQEAFFNDRKTYATALGPDAGKLGYPADAFYVGKSGNPTASSTGAIWSVTLEAGATAIAYTVTATAFSSQQKKDTDCFKLSLTHRGEKTARKSDNSVNTSPDCWAR